MRHLSVSILSLMLLLSTNVWASGPSLSVMYRLVPHYALDAEMKPFTPEHHLMAEFKLEKQLGWGLSVGVGEQSADRWPKKRTSFGIYEANAHVTYYPFNQFSRGMQLGFSFGYLGLTSHKGGHEDIFKGPQSGVLAAYKWSFGFGATLIPKISFLIAKKDKGSDHSGYESYADDSSGPIDHHLGMIIIPSIDFGWSF